MKKVSKEGLYMKIIIFLLFIAISEVGYVSAATVIDQDFLVDRNSFNQFNETPVAQTFTVGISGQLRGIDLVLSQLDPNGNLIVNIQNTVNGVPAIDNLNIFASTSIPLSQIPSSSPGGTGPGLVNIDLSSFNIVVDDGDELAVVIYKDQGGLISQWGICWYGSSAPNPTYSGGAGWYLTGLGDGGGIILFGDSNPYPNSGDLEWVYSSTDDYVFRTYVSTVPIPAAGWLLLSGLVGIIGFKKKFKNRS